MPSAAADATAHPAMGEAGGLCSLRRALTSVEAAWHRSWRRGAAERAPGVAAGAKARREAWRRLAGAAIVARQVADCMAAAARPCSLAGDRANVGYLSKCCSRARVQVPAIGRSYSHRFRILISHLHLALHPAEDAARMPGLGCHRHPNRQGASCLPSDRRSNHEELSKFMLGGTTPSHRPAPAAPRCSGWAGCAE